MITYIVATIIIIIMLIFAEKEVKKSITAEFMPPAMKKYLPAIENAADKTGVPPEIIAAVMWQESAGNAAAIGSAGEIGLMQLKYSAVEDVKKTFPRAEVSEWEDNAWQNTLAGAYYLKIQRENHSNWNEALEAYNQGARGRTMAGRIEKARNYRNSINEKISKLT